MLMTSSNYPKTFPAYVLLLLLCASGVGLNAQTAAIRGAVQHAHTGQPIPHATIRAGQRETVSDAQGRFHFPALSPTVTEIRITALGFHPQTNVLPAAGDTAQLLIQMEPASAEIQQVEVLGHTKTQEVNRQAFNVTAIDATKLYNSTLDLAGALDRVAGVRIRESGGVGSDFNLTLNGFSGNHIRFFIDGIPMDNMGSSFQMNNIPINLAERVEVYKGVTPIWLGSDALGGAVNIVTNGAQRNYLDVSYGYGSFNTHRTVVNAAATSKKGLTLQLHAYQNYSDNDYRVYLESYNNRLDNYSKPTTVKRFNDTYHNETLIANFGLVDQSFADRLLLGIVLGKNYKEIQTGARMEAVFGGLHRRGSTVMPTLKYSKTNLIEGLDVAVNANFNFGTEQNIDTLNKRFDWFGDTGAQLPPTAGERSRSLYRYRNNEGMATATASYRIDPQHSLALNNVFSSFDRKGHDELNPQNAAYERPQKTQKNILGLAYQYHKDELWNASVFAKHNFQRNHLGESRAQNTSRLGYGLTGSYFFSPNLQLKASWELTNRLPTAYEVFGDVENLEGNPALKPEKSNNLNLGSTYGFALGSAHHFSLNGNIVYRYATDFIYRRLNNNQSKYVTDNRQGVRTIGADADLRYSYKNFLSAGGSITYQHLQNMQQYEDGYTQVSPVYLDQMPNIPYFFGNADVSVFFDHLGAADNRLTVGYHLLYAHEFFLYWPSRGGRQANDEKRGIPRQLAHDINIHYSLSGGRYNIGLEARNISDAMLVDNFSLQKPGRAFYLNFRYFFSK